MKKSEEQLVDETLAENERRLIELRADYDPVTGENGPGEERVLLEIPDFAIPKQWVPRSMMKNALVKKIRKAGSIAKFLEKYPGRTELEVERLLRKIRQRHDAAFWAYFRFPIIGKEGGEIRFKFNRPQQILENAVSNKIVSKLPIDIVLDKSRQWGGSTYSIMRQTHILFELDPYHSFVVAAQTNSTAEAIVRMLKYAVSRYPAWEFGLPETETLQLMPVGKAGNAFAVKDSLGNQVLPGLIYIGSATNPDSLRGIAVMGAHYSEVSIWQDTPGRRAEDLVASISGGIQKRHLCMQVMESTAKTTDDFFHRVYTEAKEGHSSYSAIFIPWYYVPHDTLPIEDRRAFVKELLKYREYGQPYGKWKDSGKHYWWLWELGATLEGINWYRYKRLDFTSYSQMANEAPSTDIESFQAAGSHVFDVYEVAALEKYCREPVVRGNLMSGDRRGKGVLKDIRLYERPDGDLKIWEMPDDSPVKNRYLVSVDIGGPNPTSDYHSVRVLDRLMMMPEYNGKPAVVAEMHYHSTRDDLVHDAVRLAKWYNNALLVIESNTLETTDRNRNTEGDGSQYVLDLAAEIYPNLYAREAPADDIEENLPTKWGFHTNTRTKPMIIDNLQWAVRDRMWDEPSTTCIQELGSYILDHNKMTAPQGKHDDVLMSTAILLWVCFREMPLPRWADQPARNTTYAQEINLATF